MYQSFLFAPNRVHLAHLGSRPADAPEKPIGIYLAAVADPLALWVASKGVPDSSGC